MSPCINKEIVHSKCNVAFEREMMAYCLTVLILRNGAWYSRILANIIVSCTFKRLPLAANTLHVIRLENALYVPPIGRLLNRQLYIAVYNVGLNHSVGLTV